MKTDAKTIDLELKNANYKFLGWQNAWATNPNGKDERGFPVFGGYKDEPEYQACLSKGHNDRRNAEHWGHIQHNPRGSENTVWCDACRIYWKYDCSD